MTGSGSVRSGWSEATRSCGASTSRPSAPEQCATTVGGHGPDGRGDGGDGPVGNRQQQHVDTARRPRRRRRCAREARGPRRRRLRRPRPGSARAPGPDDANRCHGEPRFVPALREVPFVSQRLPERTNHSQVERHGIGLGEPLAPVRRDAGRVEVLERSKHEARSVILGCGHDEVRLGDLEIPDEQDVDVERARAVADGADPARRLLDTPGDLEQLAGAERRCRAGRRSSDTCPGTAAPERRRLVDGRDRQVLRRACAAPGRRARGGPGGRPGWSRGPGMPPRSGGPAGAPLAPQPYSGRGQVRRDGRAELANRHGDGVDRGDLEDRGRDGAGERLEQAVRRSATIALAVSTTGE